MAGEVFLQDLGGGPAWAAGHPKYNIYINLGSRSERGAHPAGARVPGGTAAPGPMAQWSPLQSHEQQFDRKQQINEALLAIPGLRPANVDRCE